MAGRWNRWDHRLFAALYDLLAPAAEEAYYAARRAEIAGGATGRVLEIGAGTGANLPHYPAETVLVAVEPNAHMLRRARRKAARHGRSVRWVEAAAEALPFEDRSFDTVVSTLVLCSVTDPGAAARDLWRVLRPGGTLRIVEHVRAEDPALARWQDRVTPVWRRLGAGCHPNRPTLAILERAGFETVQVRLESFGPAPVRPHVVAVLHKAGRDDGR
ncbi:class I SAM-dependent methyltransferase [Geochorda subterranea]|uniref:Methyltransferase domain-containing protein n=1 Tax=Geochorda subterranea TaxID=3109564 RepID=A0ABZ1BQS1_9FIRM|nr:methyltransferase domain-containing protein [Limnochorda sp. LNt]WRP14955.1 methyltransferase domain-containing protein [Limnochorda sp. LNt]